MVDEDELAMRDALYGVVGERQPSSTFVPCQCVLQRGIAERQFATTQRLNFWNVTVVANHMVAKLCRKCPDRKSCMA